jgi:transposase
VGLRCKRCGSEEHVKNGLMRTKQRYLCKACGLNFTDTPPRGKSLALKVAAVLLYVSGLSMNRTAQLLGVSTPTIQAWLEQFAAAYAQKPEPEGRAVVIELDEMWHYLKKKSEPLWVWKAWDRASGQLVDWECGGRDKAACERLLERLKRWRTRLYCADDYAVYGACSCRSGSSTRARTRRTASNGTTPASGIGWPGSAGARSWSRRPSAWWTSASPCSLASPETTGPPTSYLCWPKTLPLRVHPGSFAGLT